MVDKSIIDTVLSPMLNAPRSPGYLRKKQYKHLQEVGQKYFLTSAWYMQSQLYSQLKDYTARMLTDNSKFFACDLSYQCSIEAGLLMRETIESEMAEQSFNQISFMMEYEGKFYGSSEDALFEFNLLNSRRNLKEALYSLDYYRENAIPIPKKQVNEKRILSLDIALLASRKHDNDASCFILNQCVSINDNDYISNISFVDTKEGLVTEELGLLTMRYFYQYDCDYLAIDANGRLMPLLSVMIIETVRNKTRMLKCKLEPKAKFKSLVRGNA